MKSYLIYLVLLFTSCTSALYYPITQPVPSIKEKGEFHSAFAVGLMNASLSAAYSPASRWAAMASFEKGSKHWQWEAASGYYLPKGNFLFDSYFGAGSLKTEYSRRYPVNLWMFTDVEEQVISRSKGIKFFIQPGIHAFHKKAVFSITTRFEMIQFKEYYFHHTQIETYRSNETVTTLDSINLPGKKSFTLTPSFTFKVGNPVSFLTQVGLPLPLSKNDDSFQESKFRFWPFMLKLGLTVSIKQKKE